MSELFRHFGACRDDGSLLLAYGMGGVAGFAVAIVTLAWRLSRKPVLPLPDSEEGGRHG